MDRIDVARWRNEHAELEDRAREAVAALQGGTLEQAAAALEHFSQLLEKHFEHEEKVYFPRFLELAPDSEPRLKEAQLGHQRLREQLDALLDRVAEADLAAARRGLGQLLTDLGSHEDSEHELARWLSRRVPE